MSSEQGDRVRQSRGPTKWGCDPEAGCSAPINVAGIPYTGRSRFAGPSSRAPGRPHFIGMRTSASAGGHRQRCLWHCIARKGDGV
jgi:hypothetical protein